MAIIKKADTRETVKEVEMISGDYTKKHEEAREKVKSTVDSYVKECKDNGFTLKEMELLSEIFSEKIRVEVERAKYVTKI